MSRGFLWRAVLSFIAIVSIVPLFVPSFSSNFPFSTEARAGTGYVLRGIPGMRLPDGLQDGDVLALERMDAKTRALVFVVNNNGNVATGVQVPVVVHRGNGEFFTATATAVVNDSQSSTANRLSNYPLMLGILALALVTLWRGRDWSAWGLTLFALGLCYKQISVWPTADAWWGLSAEIISRLIMALAVIPGLYITMESLVGAGLSPRLRLMFRGGFVALLLVATLGAFGKFAGIIVWGWAGWMPYASVMSWIGIPPILMPLVLLVVGYRGSSAPQRLRVRWVLWSTGLLGGSVVAYGFLPNSDVYWRVAITGVQALSIVGYLYAVLRHRLVDVSFVIDRTLVFGLTTGFVVGVFALLEQLIERLAIGNNAGLLLQAGTTLIVALVLHRVNRRVEAAVDRLLFRRQYRSIELLLGFARECAAVEQADRLLPMAAERIKTAVGAIGIAIYESRDGRLLQRFAAGDGKWPAAIANGDVLPATLHREPQPTSLAALTGSALVGDGWAFPMILRGALSGFVVVLPPQAVQLSSEQRAALAELAQQLGVARYMLRAAEHERFIAALAAGEIDDPGDRARSLMLPETAARPAR